MSEAERGRERKRRRDRTREEEGRIDDVGLMSIYTSKDNKLNEMPHMTHENMKFQPNSSPHQYGYLSSLMVILVIGEIE